MQRTPTNLAKAFTKNPKAKAQWDELTPIARRDFVTWIESAKQAETRDRRVEKACDMLISGKRRPCCYAVVPTDLYTALNSNSKARNHWRTLSSDQRRDFADWVNSAKNADAKDIRVEQACKWLAEGKQKPN